MLCFRILLSQQWSHSAWLYTSCRMVALRPVLCQAPFKAPASIKAMPACLDTPAKRATESEEVCTILHLELQHLSACRGIKGSQV